MNIWKIYYEAYDRRQTLLDEARQYRLTNAILNIKEGRSNNSPFRIQSRPNATHKVVGLGSK